MADRKIYFATDIHGSEVCLRKFLNAGKFYGCDTLIMGGDITGKMIVPIVDRGQGVYTATLYGRNLQVTGDGLAKLTAFAQDALAEPDRRAVTERAQAIRQAIDEPSKSLRWKARARIGRHAPWYELPEEVAGNPHG